MTRAGALAAMVGGFTIVNLLFGPMLVGNARINLFGFHPVFIGLSGSFLLGFVVSKLSGPAPSHLVERYFYVKKRDA